MSNFAFELLDQLLGQKFDGGRGYGIAEIATRLWLHELPRLALSGPSRPNLSRWLAAIGSRPGTQHFEERAAEMAPKEEVTRAAASAADLDRMFGRGAFARSLWRDRRSRCRDS